MSWHLPARTSAPHQPPLRPTSAVHSKWVEHAPHHQEDVWPTPDLARTMLKGTADLQWNRSLNLESSDSEAVTLPLGHRGSYRTAMRAQYVFIRFYFTSLLSNLQRRNRGYQNRPPNLK
ncbi:hypothetical protein AVEN_153391-1 [Araneus ventricosus]|uniref:Uncharacterized protein n=1 Tax=Araneus ventricosus TaxID=182803 RepID=A0A4Y2FQG9_ARAVE|nr:hypothetical protein AVEN_153391-1 [Araneus ventricosus]